MRKVLTLKAVSDGAGTLSYTIPQNPKRYYIRSVYFEVTGDAVTPPVVEPFFKIVSGRVATLWSVVAEALSVINIQYRVIFNPVLTVAAVTTTLLDFVALQLIPLFEIADIDEVTFGVYTDNETTTSMSACSVVIDEFDQDE